MSENLFPIRVAGVPEHFNMPIHWAKNKGIFERDGIDLQWHDFASGTGAMCEALKNNEIDVAILLTEGAIVAIENGNPSTILQFYVESSLHWGIYISPKKKYKNAIDIADKRFAISRIGSGSHIMAKILASENKFTIANEKFIVVNNLDGASKAITNDEADIFLWEKFTTKPLVDRGIFNKISEIPTPWACFVIVVRNSFMEENKEALLALVGCINEATAKFMELKNQAMLISEKYQLKESDVKTWLKSVIWSTSPNIDYDKLDEVKKILNQSGII